MHLSKVSGLTAECKISAHSTQFWKLQSSKSPQSSLTYEILCCGFNFISSVLDSLGNFSAISLTTKIPPLTAKEESSNGTTYDNNFKKTLVWQPWNENKTSISLLFSTFFLCLKLKDKPCLGFKRPYVGLKLAYVILKQHLMLTLISFRP